MSDANNLPDKEIRKLLKKLVPDLNHLLDLTANDDEEDSVIGECIRSGVRSLLIADRIIKENRK